MTRILGKSGMEGDEARVEAEPARWRAIFKILDLSIMP